MRPGLTDKRRALRIAVKLMFLSGLAVVLYALSASLFKGDGDTEATALQISLSDLAPGQWRLVDWRGRTLLIVHRTPDMLAEITRLDAQLKDPASTWSRQPEAAKNPYRALKPEYFIALAYDTGVSCVVELVDYLPVKDAWRGGFTDPCQGSRYDFAGRVFKDQRAPRNLSIPPHKYLDAQTVLLGAS